MKRFTLVFAATALLAGCGPAADVDDPSEVQAQAPVVAAQPPTIIVVQCPNAPGAACYPIGPAQQVIVTTGVPAAAPVVIAAPGQVAPSHAIMVGSGPVRPAPRAIHVPPRREHPIVDNVVRSRFSRFHKCYEKGLRRDPTLLGSVTVQMRVDSDGEVDEAHLQSTNMRDHRVVECVVDEYQKLDFHADVGSQVAHTVHFGPGAPSR